MDDLRRIIGVILWWAEGTKSRRDKRWKNAVSYPVEITSTDPLVIKLFLEFIRKDLKIDESRLRVQLQIHENDNFYELESYWAEICSITKDKFQKTIIRPVGKKAGKTKGTCKIRYSDKETYLKVKGILEQVLQLVKV
jgi:hypothetical protein